MKKFLLWCVFISGLSLCFCDHHHHPPPPNRGFRPVPPPGYRPSFGPPRGSLRPCCGPPRGGYNRPSNRPPVDSYRPYWPKDPNQGNYDYQSQGYKDDNQFQSLGLGYPSTAEATVSSYFPVSSDNSYTSPYDDHSYPSSNNGDSYYNHRRPPYKPAFRPSEQVYTGPDFLARPPTNMVPPVFSGQGPDYSSPMYAQKPVNLVPFFPDPPADFSASTPSNLQIPEIQAPDFSNLPQEIPSYANQPNQNLDQIVSNLPQDGSTTLSPPADLAPIFDFSSAIIAPNPPIDLDPIFPDGPSISSPTDFWLPSGSIPSSATSATTLPPFRLIANTSKTINPPFRMFSMNSTRTTTYPPLRLLTMVTTTTTSPPFRMFSMDTTTTATTTTTYPPFRLFSMNSTRKTTSPPLRLFSMDTGTATYAPFRKLPSNTMATPNQPFRVFSIKARTAAPTTTTTPRPRVPARIFPTTVAPIYNNSLAINNVSVVVTDDDVFDRIFLDNNNCSNVFPLTESDELLLSFSFAANLTGRCVLTFTGPSGGLKVALQISNVTLMKDNGTKVDCEKQSLGVFSHKSGNLFKMEQLCGLERNSAVLLTDSQSPLITLTFVNQQPTKINTTPFGVTFNMQIFTYALQNNATAWP